MPRRKANTLPLRERTGLPQWEMASMLHVSREALAGYESRHRSTLPGAATLYEGHLLVEMDKPENQQAVSRGGLSEKGKEKLLRKLAWIVKENRYQADSVQAEIEKCKKKQEQMHQRKLMMHCAGKVQAYLLDISKHLREPFITEHQQQWVERRKDDHAFSGFDDELFISQKMLELKRERLLAEAEVAERMMGVIHDG